MTTAAVRAKFGMPGGEPVKKKQPPKGKFDEQGQVFVGQEKKPVKKPPLKKPETPLQGPPFITPAIAGQQGKRRAPSLARDEETKKKQSCSCAD